MPITWDPGSKSGTEGWKFYDFLLIVRVLSLVLGRVPIGWLSPRPPQAVTGREALDEASLVGPEALDVHPQIGMCVGFSGLGPGQSSAEHLIRLSPVPSGQGRPWDAETVGSCLSSASGTG